jgi:hypothetical protein
MRRTTFTRIAAGTAGWLVCLAGGAWIGCDRTQTPTTQAARSASQPTATAPTPADDQDDPRAPRALPDSNDVAGWIKTRPIRVTGSDRPSQLMLLIPQPERRQTVQQYRPDRVSACTYEADDITADVLFLEMADPDDAFGLFSVWTSCLGKTIDAAGMMFEINRNQEGYNIVGWQGTTCLAINVTAPSRQDADKPAEQLARHILFNMPSTDPPFILRAIPSALLTNGKVWMVHRTAALTSSPVPLLADVAAAGLDEVLGLTGAEKLWIAALGQRSPSPTAADSPPNTASGPTALSHVIWIVRYAEATDAGRAFARYQQKLASPRTGLDHRTLVREPCGTYLAGSWTADAEAANPVLPTLIDMLPSGVKSTATHPAGPTN